MNIQSISIVVPTHGCINNCKFCVSRMHENDYENGFNEFQIIKRLKFAVNNGVNTCIITGTGEPLQNRDFLIKLARIFEKMDHPFPNVELQTSGVLLINENTDNIDENFRLLTKLGVNTISLSVSDIFNSIINWEIIDSPAKYRPKLHDLCTVIKNKGFNLRLSLNLIKRYDKEYPEDIIAMAKFLHADQITFRKLWHGNDNSEQTQWVKKNAADDYTIERINEHIINNGKTLYRLPFGPMLYSINEMSVAVDDDCMSEKINDTLKYLILREDGKLYSLWNDKGSLIF